MLRVKTFIGPSAINGIGLFAAEDIPAGTVIWEFSPTFDLVLDHPEHIADPLYREFVFHHGYFDRFLRRFIVPGDNNRFINHSPTPNTDDKRLDTVAARDIKAGEELTSNYFDFCDPNPWQPWLDRLPR